MSKIIGLILLLTTSIFAQATDMTEETTPFLSRALNSPQGEVLITIDKPLEDDEGVWVTHFTIAKEKGHVSGGDSIQSLMLTLEAIRQKLEKNYPNATWEEADNHGISLQVPYFIKTDIRDKIENMMVSELEKAEPWK